jgi:hypothetical protein
MFPIRMKCADFLLLNLGTEFTTRFTLGGFLHSTRTLSEEEKKNLEQTKDKTRTAAGVSFQTPAASFTMSQADAITNAKDKGNASLFQNLRLTWEATGGNTLLCSRYVSSEDLRSNEKMHGTR